MSFVSGLDTLPPAVREGLELLRDKLYNGAPPKMNGWMIDSQAALASGKQGKLNWHESLRGVKGVPSREDKQRFLEKVYGQSGFPVQPVTKAAHVRPASAGYSRPTSASGASWTTVRPSSAASERWSDCRDRTSTAGAGEKHSRPSTAGGGKRAAGGKGALKDAYKELETAWAATCKSSKEGGADRHDCGQTEGDGFGCGQGRRGRLGQRDKGSCMRGQKDRDRGRLVPRLWNLPDGGQVGEISDGEDEDVDFEVIEEDEEEGGSESEAGGDAGDVFDERNVASPVKPQLLLHRVEDIFDLRCTVSPAQSQIREVLGDRSAVDDRDELSLREPELTELSPPVVSVVSKRVEYTPVTFSALSKKQGTDQGFPLMRPVSAPAEPRKELRLTAQGTLGKGAREGGGDLRLRPCSAGHQRNEGQTEAPKPMREDEGINIARRRQRGESQKIFIISGPFSDVRKSLLRRGWCENTTKNSTCFDLKWTLHDSEVRYGSLEKGQSVNHFEGNQDLTTKAALLRTMRGMHWVLDSNPDSTVPMSFDVSDPNEWDAFVAAFRESAAYAVIHMYVQRFENSAAPLFSSEKRDVVRNCLTLLKRRLLKCTYDDGGVDDVRGLGDKECDDVLLLMYAARERVRLGKKGSMVVRDSVSAQRLGIQTKDEGENAQTQEDVDLSDEAQSLLDQLRLCDPQYNLAGDKCVWISKASSSSKGLGISLFNKMSQATDARGTSRVLQKYVERPLLIDHYKFDLRLWVLVTSWDPLTVWVYDDCLVRFCSEKFDLNDIANRAKHLTNISINKDLHKDNAQRKNRDEGLPGPSVWDAQMLDAFLGQMTGEVGTWRQRILPEIRRLVIRTLRCAESEVRNRKESFELYGFDVMLDQDMHPWLVEVNLSPDLKHTTKLKSSISPRLVEGLVSLIVDIGTENLRKVPVGGVDATAAQQQQLLGAALSTSPHKCSCRDADSNDWAGVCACGGSGGWCLVYRGDGCAGDGVEGDLMMAVEGSKLDVKEYRAFESAMDKHRSYQAASLIQRNARGYIYTRIYARLKAASVILKAHARSTLASQSHHTAKTGIIRVLCNTRRIPISREFARNLAATYLQSRIRFLLQDLLYQRLRCAVLIQKIWRGNAVRNAWRKIKCAIVCLQSWWRGRVWYRYVRDTMHYADWLHDEYLENDGAGRTYLGVPVAWVIFAVGDVKGGKGRQGEDSQEGFRRLCLWAFRGYAEGEVCVRAAQRFYRGALARRHARRLRAIISLQAAARRIHMNTSYRKGCASVTISATIWAEIVRKIYVERRRAVFTVQRFVLAGGARRRMLTCLMARECLGRVLVAWANRCSHVHALSVVAHLQASIRRANIRSVHVQVVAVEFLARHLRALVVRRDADARRAVAVLGLQLSAAIARRYFVRGCGSADVLRAVCRRGSARRDFCHCLHAGRVLAGAWLCRIARRELQGEREKSAQKVERRLRDRESRYRRLVLEEREEAGGKGTDEEGFNPNQAPMSDGAKDLLGKARMVCAGESLLLRDGIRSAVRLGIEGDTRIGEDHCADVNVEGEGEGKSRTCQMLDGCDDMHGQDVHSREGSGVAAESRLPAVGDDMGEDVQGLMDLGMSKAVDGDPFVRMTGGREGLKDDVARNGAHGTAPQHQKSSTVQPRVTRPQRALHLSRGASESSLLGGKSAVGRVRPHSAVQASSALAESVSARQNRSVTNDFGAKSERVEFFGAKAERKTRSRPHSAVLTSRVQACGADDDGLGETASRQRPESACVRKESSVRRRLRDAEARAIANMRGEQTDRNTHTHTNEVRKICGAQADETLSGQGKLFPRDNPTIFSRPSSKRHMGGRCAANILNTAANANKEQLNIFEGAGSLDLWARMVDDGDNMSMTDGDHFVESRGGQLTDVGSDELIDLGGGHFVDLGAGGFLNLGVGLSEGSGAERKGKKNVELQGIPSTVMDFSAGSHGGQEGETAGQRGRRNRVVPGALNEEVPGYTKKRGIPITGDRLRGGQGATGWGRERKERTAAGLAALPTDLRAIAIAAPSVSPYLEEILAFRRARAMRVLS